MFNLQSLSQKRDEINNAFEELLTAITDVGAMFAKAMHDFAGSKDASAVRYYNQASNLYGLDEFFAKYENKSPSLCFLKIAELLVTNPNPVELILDSKSDALNGKLKFVGDDYFMTLSLTTKEDVNAHHLNLSDVLIVVQGSHSPYKFYTNSLFGRAGFKLPSEINSFNLSKFSLNGSKYSSEFNYADQSVYDLFLIDSLMEPTNLDRYDGLFGLIKHHIQMAIPISLHKGAITYSAELNNIPNIELVKRVKNVSNYSRFYVGDQEAINIEKRLMSHLASSLNNRELVSLYAASLIYKVSVLDEGKTFINKNMEDVQEVIDCISLSDNLVRVAESYSISIEGEIPLLNNINNSI